MEICQISNCINCPIAICLHCQQQLCIEHLLQHNDELIHQANMYCDEFNELSEQIANMSFDQQFLSAEEEIHDWINEQMKQLDKIYEQKLFQLKQTHSKVDEKLREFKEIQQVKLADIQRRLFNSQLSKQISLEQLNRMKTTIEQLRDDIQEFKTSQTLITLVNYDQKNYSCKPNIDIQLNNIDIEEKQTLVDAHQECNKSQKSRLSANAKPFDYIPKDPNSHSFSSTRQTDFTGRLFDECALIGSMNKTM